MTGPARHAQVLARAAARLDRHLTRHTLSGETRAHTAARTVAINRAVGRAAKRRRVPRQVYPRAIEADYGKRLASLVARTREALAPLLAEIPALATAARSERRDGARLDAGSSSRVEKLIEQARAAVERLSDPKDADKVAREFAATTNSYQRVQLGRQTRAALGVDLYSRDARLPSIVDHFAAENVALIRSIPSQLLDQVHQLVTRGVPGAQPVDQLQADIVARFGVAERRARLIARDQIGKLYGQVNAYRQRDLGVTRFTWRTVHDERVRSEHAALDGQTFDYDSPPSEGLPGEPIQCVPGDTRVSLHAHAVKLYRRWHRGQLTELVTDTHEPLRCTPNHPVLTARGWLPAHLVEVGDYLVEAPSERLQVAVRDPERGDPTAEEMFGALADLGIAHRVVAGAAGFHGDASDEQVDVVDVDRGLLVDYLAARAQEFREQGFARPADPRPAERDLPLVLVGLDGTSDGVVRSGGQGQALLGGALAHAQEHGLGPVALADPGLAQRAHDLAPAQREARGDLLDADVGAVQAEDLLDWQRLRALRRLQDARLARDVRDRDRRDLQSLGDEADAAEREVQRGDLRFVEVRAACILPFDGFVYNFETDTGWFGAHGLIIHNCRCSADPDFSSIQALAEDPTAPVDQPLPEPSPAPARPVSRGEATAFLNEVGDRAQTPIEQQAIRDYQGGKYIGIQDYARTSKLYEGSPFENTAEAKATLKALDGAISKGSLPRDTVLYRGVGEGRAGITGALEPGGVIRDRGYASTSIDRATAEEFAKGKPGATLFEIEAPRGTHAAFVPGDGSLQEAELLLGRGTKFHVLSVREVDGIKVARVTLRADAAAAAAIAPEAAAAEIPIWEKPKNPKRQAAARLAGAAG